MKKLYAKLLLLLFTGILCSNCNTPWNGIKGNGNLQTTVRGVSDFNEIQVSGFYDVTLVKGTENKVTINGEENLLQYIMTEVNGNQLKIYTKDGFHINTTKHINITVNYTHLSSVKLTGSGSITSKTPIAATQFTSTLTGSGNIEINLTSENTNAKVTGSGNIILQGNSNNFTCSVTGSGDIKAFDFETINAESYISGSGGIKINCTGNLKARITGSGDIIYKGTPEYRDFAKTGSGDISKAF